MNRSIKNNASTESPVIHHLTRVSWSFADKEETLSISVNKHTCLLAENFQRFKHKGTSLKGLVFFDCVALTSCGDSTENHDCHRHKYTWNCFSPIMIGKYLYLISQRDYLRISLTYNKGHLSCKKRLDFQLFYMHIKEKKNSDTVAFQKKKKSQTLLVQATG